MIGCCEREVHGVFYFSDIWWDLIPDADCSGVEREHSSIDAAPGGYVMATAPNTLCHICL